MSESLYKSVFFRAIKYSLISSGIIMLLVVYRMLTSDVVGTALEISTRFVITCFGVFGSMYVIFVFYLCFNPEADKPREDVE
ncbi:MAG: hypothetical protein WEA82_05465 [Idiomarina sp.]